MESPVWGRGAARPAGHGACLSRRDLLALAAFGMVAGTPEFAAAAGPQGQLTWGVHTTLAPTWFDPAETPGIITPWMVLYALHDALWRCRAPVYAEPRRVIFGRRRCADLRFVLRPGVKFHNRELVSLRTSFRSSISRLPGKVLKDAVAVIRP